MEKYREILLSSGARQKIKEGIEIATQLITPTLGARGRKIVIDKEYVTPEVLDDGKMILDEVKLKDKGQQLGVELLKDASGRTNDRVGDGTTTTAILTNSLVQEIIKEDEDSKDLTSGDTNVLKIKKQILIGQDKVLAYINKNKIDISSTEQLINIGKVSANSDEMGKILAELFDKLGLDASITVSDNQSLGVEYEIVDGMKFDKGFISPGFITNGDKEEAVIENANIVVTDYKIRSPKDLEWMKRLTQDYGINDLVVIADDVSDIPLEAMVISKLRGLKILATRAPGFGQMKDHLADIATLVGATVITKDAGLELKDFSLEWLGHASKIVSTVESTTIVGGQGNKKDIKQRIKILKDKMKETVSGYEKDKLKERVAKLSGGVGLIKVGGATETERNEKKAKLDDAINAVRGALEDGIVAGGGVVLLRASATLDETVEGEGILKRAIQKPFEQILKNAGLDSKSVGTKISSNKNHNYGFDVEKEEYGDMIKMGIIDPAKVTKTALQNAVSLALVVMTISGAIVNVPDKTNKKELDDHQFHE